MRSWVQPNANYLSAARTELRQSLRLPTREAFDLVYVAAKLVRIATALLKYGEKFSFEKAGISKAVLKQWELEQAKAA